jgi:hypothetical protein
MKIGGVGEGREVCCIPVDFSLGGSALPDLETGLLALPHVSTSTVKLRMYSQWTHFPKMPRGNRGVVELSLD